MTQIKRLDQRKSDELRPVTLVPGYARYAEGSCLIDVGNTRVLCTASVEEKVPPFLLQSNSGWVTAEYGMLPRATLTRSDREAARGKQKGRTQEIQRLIGRSLRAVIDLKALGSRSILIDCDVLQADGGTRTASVTGAFVAVVQACDWLRKKGAFEKLPIRDAVAATSAGILKGEPILDLNYEEDFGAEVDLNLVMTGKGELVEIQGTGEESTFTETQLNQLIGLGKSGIAQLVEAQKAALKGLF